MKLPRLKSLGPRLPTGIGAGQTPSPRRSATGRGRGGATTQAHRHDRSQRWAVWGAACGAALALFAFAPAAWLAGWVEDASGGRLLLAETRGSVWSGSAVAVLTGGPGSQEARALPGRFSWTLRPGMADRGPALLLRMEQVCCLSGQPTLSLTPGLGTIRLGLQGDEGAAAVTPAIATSSIPLPPGGAGTRGKAAARELGRWPAGWLVGLGTPWNTLELGGVLQLSTPGIALERVQGRWRVEGAAALELRDAASRVATLDRLGSYRLDIGSDPGNPGSATLRLSTLDGALRLSGNGSLGPTGLRFRGEATAAETEQPALANLLNIIGRRDGARSVIAIG